MDAKKPRIRLQQINPTIGDLEGNKNIILQAIEEAKEDGIDLIIFPELSTCGYPPQDLLERPVFRDLCYNLNDEIIAETEGIHVIFGSITPNENSGRPCFNSAIVASGGQEKARVHKALLPTYDVFDDLRYFEPGSDFRPIEIDGISYGITICEDIWFNDNEIQYHTYRINPAEKLKDKGAELIINISASPYSKNKPVHRAGMLRSHAKLLELPLLYVNQTGANTELIFDGDSLVYDNEGSLVCRAKRFEADFLDLQYHSLDKEITADTSRSYELSAPNRYACMFEALKCGLKDYLSKSKLGNKVILGLSGGVDSALVTVIAKEAMGADNVLAVTMPSEFSSKGSISDSEKLAKNLGVECKEISIKPVYDAYNEQLKPFFLGLDFNVAEENLQPRTRANLLMALSNKFGYILLATSNKSEMAVGYSTLYGDMSGALAVIADLYKTEVYAMCEWLNEEYYGEEMIPQAILTKAPSAELRPDQKDTDTLPEYETLDLILKYYLEDQLSREEILKKISDSSVVDWVLSRVDYNEFKRYQSPPVLKVSAKSFGFGRRWPIVQGWTKTEKKLLDDKN